MVSVSTGAAGPASAALYLKPPYSSGLWLGVRLIEKAAPRTSTEADRAPVVDSPA